MNKRPHVIVIMADQLRHDFIRPEYTPHICALQEESARFPRMYCASPLCVPARGSFFTGRYPNQTGCLINGWEPADQSHARVQAGTPNLYQVFESAGYDSWHTGKQHLFTADEFDQSPDSTTHWTSLENGYGDALLAAIQRAPGGPEFTGITPELHSRTTTTARRYSVPRTGVYEGGLKHTPDGYTLDQSIAAIRNRDTSRPFLLNAMFLAPHPPFEIPSPWFERYDAVELSDNVGVWNALQSPLNLYHLSGAIGARYSRTEWQEPWRAYAGLVAMLDHCVGEIIATLRAADMYEDSIILFTSDHGEMLGSHCLWQKMVLYEESIRTPASIRLPKGTFSGEVTHLPTSHIDIFPTLCDLAGIPAPSSVSGTSLAGAIQQSCPYKPKPIFVQNDGNGSLEKWSRGVIFEDRKLIVDGFKDEIFFELYDLREDPLEANNLAFTDRVKAREYLQFLQNHMRATGDAISLTKTNYDTFLTRYAYQAESLSG